MRKTGPVSPASGGPVFEDFVVNGDVGTERVVPLADGRTAILSPPASDLATARITLFDGNKPTTIPIVFDGAKPSAPGKARAKRRRRRRRRSPAARRRRDRQRGAPLGHVAARRRRAHARRALGVGRALGPLRRRRGERERARQARPLRAPISAPRWCRAATASAGRRRARASRRSTAA